MEVGCLGYPGASTLVTSQIDYSIAGKSPEPSHEPHTLWHPSHWLGQWRKHKKKPHKKKEGGREGGMG